MRRILVCVGIILLQCGCISESPTESAVREAREREKQEQQERAEKREAYISAMNPLMTRVNLLFTDFDTLTKLWNSQVLNLEPEYDYFIAEYARLDAICTAILSDAQKVTPYYDANHVTRHPSFVASMQSMLSSIKEMRAYLDAKGVGRSTLQANIYKNQAVASIQLFSDWYTKL